MHTNILFFLHACSGTDLLFLNNCFLLEIIRRPSLMASADSVCTTWQKGEQLGGNTDKLLK